MTREGRKKVLADAKRRLIERRAAGQRPIPRSRTERLAEAKRRLEQEHEVHCEANAAYERWRETGRVKNGRRFGAPPKPYVPPELPDGRINVTDLDSGSIMRRSHSSQKAWDVVVAVREERIGRGRSVLNEVGESDAHVWERGVERCPHRSLPGESRGREQLPELVGRVASSSDRPPLTGWTPTFPRTPREAPGAASQAAFRGTLYQPHRFAADRTAVRLVNQVSVLDGDRGEIGRTRYGPDRVAACRRRPSQ